MNDNSDAEAGELTLAFAVSAIERLDSPGAVFADARAWSESIGIIDDDAERITQIVAEHDLQDDFDMHDRDRWFALEELCETTTTPRHVYVGASDDDMRVATMFCWEYVRVSEAAEQAGWTLSSPESERGVISRLLARITSIVE